MRCCLKNHPFKVLDDEKMQNTVESVQMYDLAEVLNFSLDELAKEVYEGKSSR